MRYRWLWLIFPLWLHGEIQWHSDLEVPFAIMLKVSSEQVKIGAPLEIEGTFHYPDSYEVDPFTLIEQLTWSANPLLPTFSLDHWEVLPVAVENKTQAQRLNVRLIPVQEGMQSVSFLTVPFLPKEKQDNALFVSTPIFSIQVNPLLAPPTSTFAPLATLDAQFPLGLTQANRQFLEGSESLIKEKQRNQRLLQQHTFPWLSLLLGLVLSGLGGLAYLMREPLKQWFNPQPVVDPYQQAEQALTQLETTSLPPDEAYTKLTSILLSFLEERIKIKRQGLTTREMRHQLAKHALPSHLKENIIAILKEADKAKFAGSYHSAHAFSDSLQKAKAIINGMGGVH